MCHPVLFWFGFFFTGVNNWTIGFQNKTTSKTTTQPGVIEQHSYLHASGWHSHLGLAI